MNIEQHSRYSLTRTNHLPVILPPGLKVALEVDSVNGGELVEGLKGG